jgi:LAGLIDADG DNA endonuclease family/NADH-Ubiquinone oxidoreductase (complex I), chain 5 N-terminus
MYLSLIILPFLGSLISGFLGRKVGIKGSQIISCSCLFGSAVISTFAFYEVGLCSTTVQINLGTWIDSEIMQVTWSFLFDQLSVVFCIMITYITFLILVYTIYYMEGQPHVQRFFSYLSAFAGFMLILVTGGNYFVLFIGWEGELNCLKWILNLNFKYSDLDESNVLGLFLSLALNRRYFHIDGKINSNKRIGPHNVEIIQVIIGSLLGDGHLEKRNKSIGTRLIIEQTNNNVEYLMWLYNYFYKQGYCTSLKPKLFKRIKKKNTVYFGVKFNTYTFSSFNWIHNLFYKINKNGRYIKIVPISFLYDNLSPLALAVWFMDDGSKLGSGFKIATNCFELSELKELCKLLFEKYNLDCTIHSNKVKEKLTWTLYIKKNSAGSFANLIEPFMLNSMKYKLGIYSQYNKVK